MTFSTRILLQGILTITFGFGALNSSAQNVTEDTFTLGVGYEDMAFYSLENGVVAQSPLADWHIAIDVRPMGSTARINGGTGMMLYPYGTLENWGNVDFDNWEMPEALRNDQSDWANAAFSQDGDGLFDLGWGIYDVITHEVQSDKMYLIEMPDGTWKQFAFLSLVSGTYTFQVADLDGSNEGSYSISKSSFEGKLFAYFNMNTGEVLDLEPSAPWDFQFMSYSEDIGGGTYYSVVGALAHPDVAVQQMDNLDDPYTDGNYSEDSFSLATNAVGYDWKSYVPGAGYELESNRCYFVSAHNGNIWRMVMTAFGGSTNGDISIGLVNATASNVVDATKASAMRTYPNPVQSGNNLTVQAFDIGADAEFQIYGSDGSIIETIKPQSSTWTLNTSNLSSGYYILSGISADGKRSQTRLIVQ